jgi:RHS repeat-associated protein
LDEDTGLYYYGARYYDSELGRFTQADTIVPSAADPQTLNRYAYCGNNPIKYVDPSGHVFGIDDIIIGIAIGAAIGGASAAAQGGNIGMGILCGAIGGLFGGFGSVLGSASWVTAALGAVGGPLAGAVIGGAAGGAVTSAISGGDVGMGALTGAIAAGISFGVGWFNHAYLKDAIPKFWTTTFSGSLGGGIGAELQGGDFLQGAAYGAAAGAAGFVIGDAIYAGVQAVKNPSQESLPLATGQTTASSPATKLTRPIQNPLLNTASKLWTLPYSALGFAYGVLNYPLGARMAFADNAIVFTGVKLLDARGLTPGNVTLYGGDLTPATIGQHEYMSSNPLDVRWGRHEMGHTWQAQRLGPLYIPAYFMFRGNFERAAEDYGAHLY